MEKIKQFFLNKQNWSYILCCILLFLLVFFWRENDTTKTELKDLKKQEKVKEKEIDSLKEERKILIKQKDSISKEIVKTKTIINNIRTEREIRIQYVEKMGNKEIQEYFNKRYNEK